MKLFSHLTLSIRKSVLVLSFLPASCILLTAQIGELKVIKEEPVYASAAGEKLHEVKKGETLYSISVKHKMPVGDIIAANNLAGATILPGQRLIIPSATGATPAATTRGINQRVAGPAASTTSARTMVQERPIYYTVKKGDDIFSISDTEEKTIAQLKEWNPSAKFTMGERLIVGKRYENVAVAPTPAPASNMRVAAPQPQPQQIAMNTRGIMTPKAVVTRSVPVGDLGSLVTGTAPGNPNQRVAAPQPQANNSITNANNASTTYRITRSAAAAPVATQSTTGQTFELPDFNNFGQVAINQAFGEISDDRIQSTRFYAHHKTLPLGTKINLMIPDNAGFIQVEIVGRLAAGSTADIGLSPTIMNIITGANNDITTVMITYN